MRASVMLGLAGICTGALAAEAPECPKTFQVGLDEYGYGHIAGSRVGIDDELLAALERRSGCRFVGREVPRKRLLVMVQAGSIDIGMSSIYNAERGQYAHFVYYASSKNKVVLRKDAGVTTLDAFLAAPALKLGVVRGARYGLVYDRVIAQLSARGRIDESADARQLFAKLMVGRYAAILALPTSAAPMLRRYDLADKVRILDWAPGEAPVRGGMMLSKASFSAEQARRWQNLVDTLRADGSLLAIFAQYLPPAEAADAIHY